MKIIRPMGILALIYCCLGPILLLVESQFASVQPMRQAAAITFLAIFFFSYSMLSLTVFTRLMNRKSKLMTSYYLADKMIRLIACILIIVVYGLLVKTDMLIFTLNLFVYFVTTVVYTSYYCIKEEHKTSNH